jgi:hypothetical protein
MSVRVGITRLYNFTVDDALHFYGIIRDAVKTIIWFRNYWKNADPFKRYRIVQTPIETLAFGLPFVVGNLAQSLSSSISAPILTGQLSVLTMLIMISALALSMIGRGWLLRRAREAWILPDPIIAFDCVACGGRHGALAHSSHPPRRCKACKTRWKNEWVDYRKRPIVEMYMDDFNPGMTW